MCEHLTPSPLADGAVRGGCEILGKWSLVGEGGSLEEGGRARPHVVFALFFLPEDAIQPASLPLPLPCFLITMFSNLKPKSDLCSFSCKAPLSKQLSWERVRLKNPTKLPAPLCSCGDVCGHVREGQRTVLENQFSPSTLWVPGSNFSL